MNAYIVDYPLTYIFLVNTLHILVQSIIIK